MSIILLVCAVLYMVSAIGLFVFAVGIYILLFLGWHRNTAITEPAIPAAAEWPNVTIQVPVYNERHTARRIIEAVSAIDYPVGRLQIQIVDDSDDGTSTLIEGHISRGRLQGTIEHIRRADRTGFKGGALASSSDGVSGEIVALFDADFVPPPDFLRRTIPYFIADPALGFLQTRWGHLNEAQNLMTHSQAISIDGHFMVEQVARSQGNLLFGFNGTAGLLRTACIRDAGGWSGETLTEDLDLSYRAQLRGWRGLYLPDVVVPAEIPPQIAAYRMQQARWAKGITQNLKRLIGPVWASPHLTLLQKLMASFHLCQYLPQPLMLVMLILTLPLMQAGILQRLPLAPLSIAGLAPVILYTVGQKRLHRDWLRRMVFFPAIIVVSGGLLLNNSIAVAEALLDRRGAFYRTPKFADQPWHQSAYALRLDWVNAFEAALAVYCVISGVVALRCAPGAAPYLFSQALCFGVVVASAVLDSRKIARYSTTPVRQAVS